MREAFRAAGVEIDLRIMKPAEIEKAIRAEAEAGAELIGAAGGDGTLSAAANALTGTASALLPIPLGTLNHFSNRYAIGSIEAAVHAYERRHITQVHVGALNERIFVNNASCGFYPHVVRHRDNIERVLPRVPSMLLAGIRVLVAWPMMKLKLEIGGMQKQLRTPALWVGIGRNSLRLPVPGDAEVEGNVLEIVAGRADSRRHIVRLAVRLLWHLRRGLEPQGRDLVVEHASAFTLNAPHPIDVALDGEAFRMRGPLKFALRPNALRVVCLVASGS